MQMSSSRQKDLQQHVINIVEVQKICSAMIPVQELQGIVVCGSTRITSGAAIYCSRRTKHINSAECFLI